MIQFYAPDIESSGCLEEAEAAHCFRVLRMRPGDRVTATDGRGYRFSCIVTGASPKRVEVEIESKEFTERLWQPQLVLAVAPTKNNERMEWLVEKAVEIGIDSFILLRCERSERKVVKTDRLRRIMVSAMNQSLQCRLPELRELTTLKEVVEEPFDGDRFIAHCVNEEERHSFPRCYSPGRGMLMAIGPEGDFSPAEISVALDAGFSPVSLGPTRLRTETAALFSLTAAHTIILNKS